MKKQRDDTPIALSIAALTCARTVINVARRFAYPFLPAISRELGVSLAEVQGVVAGQGGIGVLGPLFGPLAGRYGHKRVLLGALTLLAAASALGLAAPQFGPFLLVILVFGVAKAIYDPAMQAYIGGAVPYARRARAIGVTELAWSLALVIGAPAAGYLLDASGLRAVFAALLAASLGALALLWRVLPAGHNPDPVNAASLREAWRVMRSSRAALAGVGFSMLFVVANEMLMINYGAWMELSFDLPLALLGAATITIALAEVVGEALVTGFADRLGKRRLALGCALLACVCYPVLPWLSANLWVSLAGLFALFVFVEMAIVVSIVLFTETLPQARSVMMSSNVAAQALGRLVGAQVGMGVYGLSGSFALIGIMSAVVGLGAAAVLWRWFDGE
ncbi:MAG: MFS transporter [Anaerolineae bacterium]|nr:MFS transporter [Anaerolineae bacterium]